jgi:hypothetical protein
MLATGILVGLATLAKISGALLGLALLVVILARRHRVRWSTIGPWAAIAVAGILIAPVANWEIVHGYPMLVHRLISTQFDAGVSLRNLGILIGGQALYVTPPFLIGAYLLMRKLWRSLEDPVSHLLFCSTAIPALVLLVLCLWSRRAEPHWLAPAYLALGIEVARGELIGRVVARVCMAFGAVAALLGWALTKTPVSSKLLGEAYRPNWDITNDLYAWGPARDLLRDAVARAEMETHRVPAVVGPHWVVCAQAHVALARMAPVGCNGPLRDDFDYWYPRHEWFDAAVILFVTDSRFDVDLESVLPERVAKQYIELPVQRGGRTVRTIRIARLEKVSDVAAGSER